MPAVAESPLASATVAAVRALVDGEQTPMLAAVSLRAVTAHAASREGMGR